MEVVFNLPASVECKRSVFHHDKINASLNRNERLFHFHH